MDPLYSVQYEKYLSEQPPADNEHIFIDAHVLHTPVIADLDGDKHDELIVPVSYYFDRCGSEKMVYLCC
jgi:hypothetical protein